MKSVLEELYYGNIRPFANRRKGSEKNRRCFKKWKIIVINCLIA